MRVAGDADLGRLFGRGRCRFWRRHGPWNLPVPYAVSAARRSGLSLSRSSDRVPSRVRARRVSEIVDAAPAIRTDRTAALQNPLPTITASHYSNPIGQVYHSPLCV